MKSINKLMVLLLATTMITACSGKKPSDEPKEPDTPVEPEDPVTPGGDDPGEDVKDNYITSYDLSASLRKKESTKKSKYHLKFTLNKDMFDGNATEFSKDIALLSYGNTLAGNGSFYADLGFDNIVTHFVTPTKDSLSYAFAHHNLNGDGIVSVYIKGFEYEKEWENNFDIGESGDHAGFKARTLELYEALKTYLASYPNIKLWITGYSRAGAISNMLAHYIMSKEEIDIPQDNLFVYTFETPKGLLIENAPKYENVFNLVNSGDLITYVLPEEYGLARCGTDIDIYQDNFSELVAAFDEDIDIPEFKADTSKEPKYTTQTECINYLLSVLMEERPDYLSDEDKQIYIPTREDFARKLVIPIQTLFDIFYSLPQSVLDQMMADLKSKGALGIASIVFTENGLYDFVHPYLDAGNYSYQEETLKPIIEDLRLFLHGKGSFLLQVFGNEDLKNNAMRSVYMHFPEINYILLSNYNPAAEAAE